MNYVPSLPEACWTCANYTVKCPVAFVDGASWAYCKVKKQWAKKRGSDYKCNRYKIDQELVAAIIKMYPHQFSEKGKDNGEGKELVRCPWS